MPLKKPPSERALIRFQVVSAYLAIDPPRGQRHVVRKELAAKTWTFPDGRPFPFAAETLRGWVRAYRRHGLNGLEDSTRSRVGVRVLTPAQIELVCDLKRKVPQRSIDRIIEIAEDLEKVPRGLLKRSTVHRVLVGRGLSKRPKGKASTADLDRFEAAWANDLWQSDMRTGPYLPDPSRPGKRRQTWLSLFLDDHSRLILSWVWSFKNDRHPLMRAFREALRRHGRPLRVYYDNGGPYVSEYMKQVAAIVSRGDKPIYTTPRRPEGHGKIEAVNRLIKSAFVAEVTASTITTLEELNQAFGGWVKRYNVRVHSETEETPRARWLRGAARIEYIDESVLQEAFRFRVTRTADKAGVFSLFGCRYQVGARCARRKVQVHYDPDDLALVDVWTDGQFRERVQPLAPAPQRRPKAPVDTRAAEAPAASDRPTNEWVDLLLDEGRAVDEAPDPVDEMLAEQRRLDDEVVALIEAHVVPDVFDEARVRDFLGRYGPLDPRGVDETLALAIDFGGMDQHLDQLLADLLELQEAP